MLSTIESFDGRILQEAIFSTLERRGTPLKKDQKLFTENFSKNKESIIITLTTAVMGRRYYN